MCGIWMWNWLHSVIIKKKLETNKNNFFFFNGEKEVCQKIYHMGI